jgi:endonuclease/exonuclease/phosphatase family metal-dependent hydrolase
LVFVVLLVLSYIATFISPRVSPWIPFFGLAYPYLLIANIFFIGIWIRFKKWRFLISLMAILLGWSHLSAFFQVNSSNQKDNNKDQSFSILSYNVRLFDLYNWSHNKETKSKIFDFLQSEKPDVMCFQEFYYDETKEFVTLESIKEFENINFYHAEYTFEVKDIYHFGIATFSKYPIINRGSLSFQNTNNICIFSDIVIEKDTIRVYNNHLQSIRLQPENYNYIDSLKFFDENARIDGIIDIYRRVKEAYIKRAFQVEVISDHIKESPFPVIVCGDFNDSPFSYTYRRMRGKLSDSFIEAGNGMGNTYARKFPSFRIDYLLHDSKFECVEYNKYKVYYSDHFPIIGHFKSKGFVKD